MMARGLSHADLTLPGALNDKSKTRKYFRTRVRQLAMYFTSTRNRLFALLISLVVLWLLLSGAFNKRKGASLIEILTATSQDVARWGDWVAMGRGRDKLKKETPSNYVNLVPRLHSEGQHFWGRSKSGEAFDLLGYVTPASFGGEAFAVERHGAYGGAHIDWDSGIPGLGRYLGELDMHRDETKRSIGSVVAAQHSAALSHYQERGFDYETEEDLKEAKLRLKKAGNDTKQLGRLPLRERVLENAEMRGQAIELWSRIYGAYTNQRAKSSLQQSIEKLVRGEPVVVFSKTYCPYVHSTFNFRKSKSNHTT